MDFNEIQNMCQRAVLHSLNKIKLFATALVIVLCGLLVVFFQSLGLFASSWIAFSLNFLPLFLSGGLLMGLGVVLIKSYHDEMSVGKTGIYKLLISSWHAALSSAYVFMPIILLFLACWALLGFFCLIQEIPMMGDFFASIMSSGPFLLHLLALLLCILSIYILFVMTPNFALKTFAEASGSLQEVKVYFSHLFTRGVMLLVAIFPLAVSSLLLSVAAQMTTQSYAISSNHIQVVIQWLMIMLPYAILLSPSVVFFFNMALETHAAIYKKEESLP